MKSKIGHNITGRKWTSGKAVDFTSGFPQEKRLKIWKRQQYSITPEMILRKIRDLATKNIVVRIGRYIAVPSSNTRQYLIDELGKIRQKKLKNLKVKLNKEELFTLDTVFQL